MAVLYIYFYIYINIFMWHKLKKNSCKKSVEYYKRECELL